MAASPALCAVLPVEFHDRMTIALALRGAPQGRDKLGQRANDACPLVVPGAAECDSMADGDTRDHHSDRYRDYQDHFSHVHNMSYGVHRRNRVDRRLSPLLSVNLRARSGVSM